MKKKPNKNIIYIIAIIITILIIFSLIFILNNKKTSNNSLQDDTYNSLESDKNYVEEEFNDEDIIENTYAAAVDYFETENAFCGVVDKKETYPGNDQIPNGYFKSKSYFSISELESELLQVITKELLTKHNFYNNYIEENETLYCANLGKNDTYDDITFKITKVTKENDTKISANITTKIKNGSKVLNTKQVKITLLLEEDKWKINEYDVVK